MNEVERAIRDLVIANRILAKENVVDAYGHVSIRHPLRPDRYLLSRSLSPEFVTPDDIIEFTLDGEPVSDKRPPYLERFIHGAIYEARSDVQAAVHSHAEDTAAVRHHAGAALLRRACRKRHGNARAGVGHRR